MENSCTVLDALTAACAAQRINNGYYKWPTGEHKTNLSIVRNILSGDESPTEEDKRQANRIVSYCRGMLLKTLGVGISSYDKVVLEIVADNSVSINPMHLGVISSMPNIYLRKMYDDSIKKRLVWSNSESLGSPGDRVQLNVNILLCIYSPKWNRYYITAIASTEQPVAWSQILPLEIGTTLSITGTIREYKHHKTFLNRVKEAKNA